MSNGEIRASIDPAVFEISLISYSRSDLSLKPLITRTVILGINPWIYRLQFTVPPTFFGEVSLLCPPPRVSYGFANLTFFLSSWSRDSLIISAILPFYVLREWYFLPRPLTPQCQGGGGSARSRVSNKPPIQGIASIFNSPPPHCTLFQGDMLGFTPPFPRIPRCFQPANHIRPPFLGKFN